MIGTHHVLAYVDDVNLISDDIRAIERNADVLVIACKDIELVVNIQNKCMFSMSLKVSVV
jgi:hypothetical protein